MIILGGLKCPVSERPWTRCWCPGPPSTPRTPSPTPSPVRRRTTKWRTISGQLCAHFLLPTLRCSFFAAAFLYSVPNFHFYVSLKIRKREKFDTSLCISMSHIRSHPRYDDFNEYGLTYLCWNNILGITVKSNSVCVINGLWGIYIYECLY